VSGACDTVYGPDCPPPTVPPPPPPTTTTTSTTVPDEPPDLPLTGGDIAGLAGIGLALVITGTGLLARRRAR
jgi:LPXTG-motif cell wall-anchored protein